MTNATAARYRQRQGWQLSSGIERYSFTRSGNENA